MCIPVCKHHQLPPLVHVAILNPFYRPAVREIQSIFQDIRLDSLYLDTTGETLFRLAVAQHGLEDPGLAGQHQAVAIVGLAPALQGEVAKFPGLSEVLE